MTKAFCSHCNEELIKEFPQPCPKCGKKGKKGVVDMTETTTVSENIFVKHEGNRIKKNYKIMIILFGLTIIIPIFGYIVDPVLGLVFGIIFGSGGLVFGTYAYKEFRFSNTYQKG